MNVQKFIDHFDNITNASNGIDEIRDMILKLAIRGRLTTQYEGETAEDILVEIAQIKGHTNENKATKRDIHKPYDFQPPFDVPMGWVWERLENIAEINMGQSPPSTTVNTTGKGIPFYQGKAEFGDIFPTPQRWCEQPKKIANAGDVLLSVRAPVGPTNICPEISCIGRGLAAISSLGSISDYYILFGLRAFSDVLKSKGVGSTFVAIKSKDIKSFLFPVPPAAEQERIVARIEELFVLCDQLEAKQNSQVKLRKKTNHSLISEITSAETIKDLEAAWHKYSTNMPKLLCTEDGVESLKEALITLGVIGKLEDFTTNDDSQKIVQESLAHKKKLLAAKEIIKRKLIPSLTQDEILYGYPSHWSVSRFEDLGYVSGGVTKGRRLKGKTTASYPYLRVANVQRGHFILDNVKEIEIPEDEFEKYVLRDGDILIAEGGDWDKVGRTAIWREQVPDCLHQNHVFKARLFSKRIEKEWIELVFNSSIGRQYWAGASKQTTNLASINMTQVRSFPVPIPPQNEQQHILIKLSGLLSICDELIEKIRKAQKIQANFSKAATYSILYDKAITGTIIDDQFQTKPYDRFITIKISVVSIMDHDLSNTILAKILAEQGGQMEARVLWKASKLEEIDDFYALLKQEIEAGFIQEPGVAEISLVEKVK